MKHGVMSPMKSGPHMVSKEHQSMMGSEARSVKGKRKVRAKRKLYSKR